MPYIVSPPPELKPPLSEIGHEHIANSPYSQTPVTSVTVVTNGENGSVSSQNSDIQKTPLATTQVTEDLAAKAPANDQTDEVARIKAAWRVLGIKDLDGVRARAGLEPVREHLANLRSWKNKRKSRDGRK